MKGRERWSACFLNNEVVTLSPDDAGRDAG